MSSTRPPSIDASLFPILSLRQVSTSEHVARSQFPPQEPLLSAMRHNVASGTPIPTLQELSFGFSDVVRLQRNHDTTNGSFGVCIAEGSDRLNATSLRIVTPISLPCYIRSGCGGSSRLSSLEKTSRLRPQPSYQLCSKECGYWETFRRILLRAYVLLVLLGGDTNQSVHADRVEGGGQTGARPCFETSIPLLWSTMTSPCSPVSAVSY